MADELVGLVALSTADDDPAMPAVTPPTIATGSHEDRPTRGLRARVAPNRHNSVQASASEPIAWITEPTMSRPDPLVLGDQAERQLVDLDVRAGQLDEHGQHDQDAGRHPGDHGLAHAHPRFVDESFLGAHRARPPVYVRIRMRARAPAGRLPLVAWKEVDSAGLFGDPDDLQRRLGEFAEQMQGAQRLAWADNAIKLAVDLTVAAMNRVNIQGTTEQQAEQLAR